MLSTFRLTGAGTWHSTRLYCMSMSPIAIGASCSNIQVSFYLAVDRSYCIRLRNGAHLIEGQRLHIDVVCFALWAEIRDGDCDAGSCCATAPLRSVTFFSQLVSNACYIDQVATLKLQK